MVLPFWYRLKGRSMGVCVLEYMKNFICCDSGTCLELVVKGNEEATILIHIYLENGHFVLHVFVHAV